MISPGYAQMSEDWHMSYNTLNGGLGWGIFTIDISCFFTNAFAVIWGRRPIFLLGILPLFISSLWGYFAHSYSSLLASRNSRVYRDVAFRGVSQAGALMIALTAADS